MRRAASTSRFLQALLEKPTANTLGTVCRHAAWAKCFASTLSRPCGTHLGRYFKDQRLQQLFGRYATYCGSSPFRSTGNI